MLKYVEETLTKNGGLRSKNICHPFRNRFEHTKRVFKWLERILPDFPNCDAEVARIAVIFHDIGYGGDDYKSHHSDRGAVLFKQYAKNLNLSQEKIDQIVQIILAHSNKNLIFDEKSSEELILVLEADLLDEEGALGIAFDLMAAGAKNPSSYQDGITEIMLHTAHIFSQNPMKTPLAKMYWDKKKELVKNFVEAYSFDLQ